MAIQQPGLLADIISRVDGPELADRLKVDPNTVYRWRVGLRLPPRKLLPSLSEALGISLDELQEARRVDKKARTAAKAASA